MKIFVYPYRSGSKSAKRLAEALEAKRIKLLGSKFKESPSKVVLNWGSSSCPYECLNDPSSVSVASDKLLSLKQLSLSGISVPDWTTDRQIASGWLTEGHTVVCRGKLNGSSGEGITLVSKADMSIDDEDSVDHGHGEKFLPDVPLYTKYTKKKDEYRVHVFDGKVIDVQRKMRKKDVPDQQVDWKVRNLAGGFIFGREGVNPDDSVLQESTSAVQSLGLVFGAVDIGFHLEEGARVYEVNTAPGLEGSTVDSYVKAIKEYLP